MITKHAISPNIQIHCSNVFDNGEFCGVGKLWLSIRPHNIFNNGKHNGNDFTAEDCVQTFTTIFDSLGITETEYDLLQVVNLEFGANIVLPFDIKRAVNGFLYHKRTPFTVNKYPYNRITAGSKYKRLKVYAKGIQMHERGIKEVPLNTFRFEVKTNEAKNIRKYGLFTAKEIFTQELYQTFGNELIKEFRACLWVDLEDGFSNCNHSEKRYLKKANRAKFWDEIMLKKQHRYDVCKFKAKMSKKSSVYKTLDNLLKNKTLTLNNLQNSTRDSSVKIYNIPPRAHVLKVEFCNKEPQHTRKCEVTGLEIEMQRKDSFLLSETGLRWHYENNIKEFERVAKIYLPKRYLNGSLDEQIKMIYHTIRCTRTNREVRQKRLYAKEQEQLLAV